MNRDEAKFILSAYRPGGADAHDAQFAEALDLAKRDPELAAWFAAQQDQDSAVALALQNSPVPDKLKAQILAGGKIVATAPFSRLRILWVAAAAVMILLTVAGAGLWRWKSPTFATFRSDMVDLLEAGDYQLALRSADPAEVMRWLEAHKGHTSIRLPAGVDGLPTFGCEVLGWKGRAVSLICFQTQGSVLHLFVLNNAGLPDVPKDASPLLVPSGERVTASWSDGSRSYLLAATTEKALREVLRLKG